jgi:hypothetical protein
MLDADHRDAKFLLIFLNSIAGRSLSAEVVDLHAAHLAQLDRDRKLVLAGPVPERALDAAVHVWSGMPHVFPSAIGRLKAANLAADEIGGFLRDCLR